MCNLIYIKKLTSFSSGDRNAFYEPSAFEEID